MPQILVARILTFHRNTECIPSPLGSNPIQVKGISGESLRIKLSNQKAGRYPTLTQGTCSPEDTTPNLRRCWSPPGSSFRARRHRRRDWCHRCRSSPARKGGMSLGLFRGIPKGTRTGFSCHHRPHTLNFCVTGRQTPRQQAPLGRP